MSAVVEDPVAERVQKWLGDIPSGWSGARLFEVADAWTSNVDKHTVEGQPSVRLCNYVDVYKNDSIVDSLDFMAATATREQIRKFRIRVGDTLITKDSETADDIGVPAFVEYEADDLICGYHLAIVRPHTQKVIPKFLYWAIGSEPIARQWGVTAAGVTRVGIRSTDLNKVTIPLPSPDEQRAIADYLDHETAQIDALVAKQEEFIGLLRERRSSLVTRRVTHAMVERSPLRRVVDVIDCAHVTADFVDDDERYPVASIRECQGATVDLSNCKYTTEKFYNHLRASGRAPRVGDLLFIRNVSVGFVAAVAPGTREFAVGQETVLLRRKENVDPTFLRYALTSAEVAHAIEGAMIGATFRRINVSAIGSLPVPVPRFDEQMRIATQLDEQTARIDTLIAKAEEHIALAKERRAALITAAVTGQFDVRTARKAG